MRRVGEDALLVRPDVDGPGPVDEDLGEHLTCAERRRGRQQGNRTAVAEVATSGLPGSTASTSCTMARSPGDSRRVADASSSQGWVFTHTATVMPRTSAASGCSGGAARTGTCSRWCRGLAPRPGAGHSARNPSPPSRGVAAGVSLDSLGVRLGAPAAPGSPDPGVPLVGGQARCDRLLRGALQERLVARYSLAEAFRVDHVLALGRPTRRTGGAQGESRLAAVPGGARGGDGRPWRRTSGRVGRWAGTCPRTHTGRT